VRDVREAVALPVIANGEIWSVQDALRCREVTGCDTLMIGRGLVRNPGLALAIVAADRRAQGIAPGASGIAWSDLLPLIADFWRLIATHVEPRHRSGRLKQWLNYMRRHYPEAEQAFTELRLTNDPARIALWLAAQQVPVNELALHP
jgi:tRNA-dihydrouridine synthase C